VIGTVGSDSVIKGLLSGVFGLWLSTVGYSPILGESRFAFSEHISGGIHIVAALIGLFAVPQIFQLMIASRRDDDASTFGLERHSLWTSIQETLSRYKAWLLGTITGIIVGVIPGAGGQIAGLVAYDQSRKLSRNPERFGKGEPDGVICVESANNAMVGPSLVPLLTLGIPGSPTAAVLLGGLLINGLFPGPDLFTVHAEVTWTFINALLIAQVLMLVFGLILSRYSNWVMQVPSRFMAAAVSVLAVFGTYSIQNSYSDVLVMLVLGVGMYFASRLGFSAAPIVLGIILGPIAEDNYLQGQMIAEAMDGMFDYFFLGPVDALLIALCLFSVLYSLYTEIRTSRRKSS